MQVRRPHRVLGVLLTCAVALVSCGSPSVPREAHGPPPPGFPVTVDNCGVTTTYDRPPERVVTIHQHATEVMLALGLGDRLVGTAYPDNEVLPQHRAALDAVPKLSDKAPSFEQVLASGPDMVYGGYSSAFEDHKGTSREAYQDAGVRTHLNAENCTDGPIGMDRVYDEIGTIGRVFGVQDRAQRLRQDMRRSLVETTERLRGVDPASVFVYDSGHDTAFTAGGRGIGSEILRQAGGRNAFADVPDVFADVSWEQVMKRSPEAIVLYDYSGSEPVEAKKQFLLSKPELREVPADRKSVV